MSQQTLKTGRRTPLSLNAGKQQQGSSDHAAKTAAAANAANPSKSSRPTNNNGNDKPVADGMKQAIIMMENFEASKNVTVESNKASSKDNKKAKHDQSQVVDDGAKSKKSDKKKDKDVVIVEPTVAEEKSKKDQKESEKSSTNGTNGAEANGNGEAAKGGNDLVRESPRQKALREAKEKEDEQQQKEAKKRDASKSKKPETDDSVAKVASEITASPDKKSSTKNGASNHDFTDEMPVLRMDDEDDAPLASFTTKVLKPIQSPPQSSSYSTVKPVNMNLTPSKEQIAPTSTSTPTIDPTLFANRPISARRSLRTVHNGSFSSYRETYRRLADDLNDTSMNVTVGSEAPNDSFRTSFFMGGRKRTADDASNEDMETAGVPITPKKVRLDLSGFLGFVASPVTKLRARFQRSKLDCSQPIDAVVENEAGEEALEEEKLAEGSDVVANVIDDKEQLAKELLDEVASEAIDLEADGQSGDVKAAGEVDGKDEQGDEKMEVNDDDIVVEAAPRKSRCIVM